MIYAVKSGKTETVDLLLRNHAEITIRNKEGYNAFDIAHHKEPALIAPLLAAMAALPLAEQSECLSNIDNSYYPNALYYAAAKRHPLFEGLFDRLLTLSVDEQEAWLRPQNIYLLDVFADMIAQLPEPLLDRILALSGAKQWMSSDETLLLVHVAKKGLTSLLGKLLVVGSPPIEAADKYQNRALHWAASNGHDDSVALLLSQGAEIDAPGREGRTALALAVLQGRRSMVHLLLQHHARIDITDRQNKNAIDHALNNLDVLLLLLEHLQGLPRDKWIKCLRLNFTRVRDLVSKEKRSFFNDLTEHLLRKEMPDGSLFNDSLNQIYSQLKFFEQKAHSSPAWMEAARMFKDFFFQCLLAKSNFLDSDEDEEQKILAFKSTCQDSLAKIRPEITRYRELGSTLLLMPSFAMRFFCSETKIMKILKEFGERISQFGTEKQHQGVVELLGRP